MVSLSWATCWGTRVNVHSRWVCPGCGREYESPVCGTGEVAHACTAGAARKWRRFRRVWRSKYDKMKESV
jgi:hypothetical protein